VRRHFVLATVKGQINSDTAISIMALGINTIVATIGKKRVEPRPAPELETALVSEPEFDPESAPEAALVLVLVLVLLLPAPAPAQSMGAEPLGIICAQLPLTPDH